MNLPSCLRIAVFVLGVIGLAHAQQGPLGVQAPGTGIATYSELGDAAPDVTYELHPGGRYLRFVPSLAVGTWSYRRITTERAEITIDGTPRTLIYTVPADRSNNGALEGAGAYKRFILNGGVWTAQVPNVSFLTTLAPGRTAVAGFVIAQMPAAVLIRAVGPGLATFGVKGTLARTRVRLQSSSGGVVAENDDWARSAQTVNQFGLTLGAFPLPEGSRDSAVALRLEPGTYVVEVSSPDAADIGQVLLEVYILN